MCSSRRLTSYDSDKARAFLSIALHLVGGMACDGSMVYIFGSVGSCWCWLLQALCTPRATSYTVEKVETPLTHHWEGWTLHTAETAGHYTPLRRLDTAHCWDGWTLYTSEKAVNYTPFLYGRDSLIVLCMLGRMQALVLCVPDEHIHVQLAALQK